MHNEKPILLVEDDMVDAMTIKRAMNEINITNPVHHAHNGLEALDFLQDTEAARPCIILLDLNMPKMNGIEFLQEIKNLEEFQTIPVVVLTTSRQEQDKLASFQKGVAGYMNKPVDYKQFVELIRSIKLYWTISEIAK
jgi:CheY-like chemotaxis protein